MTTKASRTPFTEAKIRETHANSAAALQMQTIPLYQLHRYDTETPIVDQMATRNATRTPSCLQSAAREREREREREVYQSPACIVDWL